MAAADPTGVMVASVQLEAFASAVLRVVGVPQADAATVAEALVGANLEGIDTHGVSRLAIYTRRVRAGLIAAAPELRWSHPAAAVALLDADNALGPVAAVAAVDEAVRLAGIEGIGMVAVAHTNHAAALSIYTERAAAAGCAALLVGNTPPAMPPWGGRTPFLGTNPLSFATPAPTLEEPPVVVDMATTLVARGAIIMAARQGQPILEGWAIDAEGQPTTDAQAALAGAVLPMAGAKGYALALMIEILSAVFSGAAWGPQVRSPYDDWTAPTDAGLWCLAIDLAPLMSGDTYAHRLGGLLDGLRATPAAAGAQIRIPGERRAQVRAERGASGIPIDATTRAELDTLATEVGVAPLEWEPAPAP